MKQSMQNLAIDAARLWTSLMEMAQIGATDKGGVCRLALTELDAQARDLFCEWCRDAGCEIRIDAMGNVFARRPGRDPDRHPVATGSHLDTQPTGGKFDGIYGVLAGLEVLRTLNDAGIETDAPIEVAVWTNEEGSRFAPSMIGSGVWAGVFDLEYGHSRADLDGVSIQDALTRIGYLGDAPFGHPLEAFFEVHIEQGPILEASEKTIGVVTGVQGIRWYDVALVGAESHAGPTPMDARRDALKRAAELVGNVYRIALERAPHGRATVGEFRISPGSRNTVPGRVELTVDLRHPDEQTLLEMDEALAAACLRASDDSVEVTLQPIWYSPPVAFDADCIASVRASTERAGYSYMDAVSGAGHDAVYVSKVAPTAMIFIPCENGISHNEIENVTRDDVEAGANVLLNAMLERAGASSPGVARG